MKMSVKAALIAAALVAFSTPSLLAQWANYPKAGVPRLPSGEVDLDAPPPRTPEGKIDFSGVWLNGRGQAPARGAGPGAAAPARGAGAGAAPAPGAARGGRRGAPPTLPADGGPPYATFGNAGAGFPEGLPFQPWARALMEERREQNSKDNPDALCLPMGLLQFHLQPQPRKIVQTKDLVVIIYEANDGLRQIFMDGRPLPPLGEPQPFWYGYSIGRWEGDTLVVESNNFRDLDWLDVRGSPMTDQAKVTEKFRRPKFGQLEIEMTIDDPKAYTKPFTVRIAQRLGADMELIEFVCNENQKFLEHAVGK